MKTKILIVDDDDGVRSLLEDHLRRAGYHILQAGDGARAVIVFHQQQPALVVLDLILPGLMTGWEVCREIRSHSDVPILMLTSLGHENQQIAGLELGADDYITKPFSARQLVARVRALLRRAGRSQTLLAVGPLWLDAASHTAGVDDRPISLTAREFALLETLLRYPSRAFSRGELLDRCWEPGFEGVDRVVDVHVGALRRKLGAAGKHIVAVRGLGYRLEDTQK